MDDTSGRYTYAKRLLGAPLPAGNSVVDKRPEHLAGSGGVSRYGRLEGASTLGVALWTVEAIRTLAAGLRAPKLVAAVIAL
jgi:hypothetical protein